MQFVLIQTFVYDKFATLLRRFLSLQFSALFDFITITRSKLLQKKMNLQFEEQANFGITSPVLASRNTALQPPQPGVKQMASGKLGEVSEQKSSMHPACGLLEGHSKWEQPSFSG